jgi:2-oxoglutarate dehydrogenase complex dihydrolipoamide succinyltransferase (E2) component
MATVLKVPQMGESVVEGTINKWFVEVGQPIKKDQPIVELLTDKVNVSLPADADGVLLEILAPVGTIVPVGKDIAIIGSPGEKVTPSVTTTATPVATVAKAAPAIAMPVPAPVSGEPQRLSPAVRRLVKEYGVDVTQLQGTGAGGRVTQKDVEDYIARMGKPAPATAPTSAFVTPSYRPPVTGFDSGKPTEQIPIPRIRKLISEHMVKSRQTSAHVTTFDECDFTRLVQFRQQHVDRIEKEQGIRITYMPFLIAAACKALKEFPYVNASLTEDKIILKHYYNIGVAVARETGLIVPVIKDADSKGVVELMRDLKDLGDRARTDRLIPDDIEDGTFSITNAGVYGALNSTPIISQPQVAILGVHTIQKRPVVREGQIVIRDMMNLGMSFDHRLIDGHYAVQFLRRLITYLEAPELMLL